MPMNSEMISSKTGSINPMPVLRKVNWFAVMAR